MLGGPGEREIGVGQGRRDGEKERKLAHQRSRGNGEVAGALQARPGHPVKLCVCIIATRSHGKAKAS